jgi:molybdopterin synthase sulfur carrier subunit
MVALQYFASVREAMGREAEQLELPAGVTTVAELMQFLAGQDADFASLEQGANPLLVAVNQTVVDSSAAVKDGDEIAFFPPMTGG